MRSPTALQFAGLIGLALIVVSFGCKTETDTPDEGFVFIDPPEIGEQQNTDTGPTGDSGAVLNECGTGCPDNQICSFCYTSRRLQCVVPLAGAPGSVCGSDAACQTGRCVVPPEKPQGRCAESCDPLAPASCLVQPFNTCQQGTISGDGSPGSFCMAARCGALDSVCGLEGCECDEGFVCLEEGAVYGRCIPECAADVDCPTGHLCGDEGRCLAVGLRPGTAPCEEGEQCASGQCDFIPGTDGKVCLSQCSGCNLCPVFSSGCEQLPGTCVIPEDETLSAYCAFIQQGDAGSLCGGDIICEAGGGSGDGADGADGADGVDQPADDGQDGGDSSGEPPSDDGGDGEPGQGTDDTGDGAAKPDGLPFPGADEAPDGGETDPGVDSGDPGGDAGGDAGGDPGGDPGGETGGDPGGDPDTGDTGGSGDPGSSDEGTGDTGSTEGGTGPGPDVSESVRCIVSTIGNRCASGCTLQADCEDNQICMSGALFGDAEAVAAPYCLPRIDGGPGDCCGPNDPCRSQGVGCALDGVGFVCALPCETTSQCPPEYLCTAKTDTLGSLGGKWCVRELPPSNEEVCNGFDDDFDGIVDEGADGESLTQPCYAGPAGTLGIGICAAGIRTCQGGAYGECFAQKLPIPDGPNGPTGCDGFDNDCDGAADEGCPCSGQFQACGSTVGACEEGVQLCQAGTLTDCIWGIPETVVWPTVETCDGTDNDCDGIIDNTLLGSEGDLALPCGDLEAGLDGVGICVRGSQTCNGECTGEVLPAGEECDGQDNDCDGLTDEGCPCEADATWVCGTSVGACSAGTQACVDGTRSESCQGAVGPSAEQCDGEDNDCDGWVDNLAGSAASIERPCWDVPSDPDGLQVGLGACAFGAQRCLGGGWSTCLNVRPPGFDTSAPQGDTCADGIDGDCDGSIDEGCPCANEGQQTLCGVDTGACAKGAQKCANGIMGPCLSGKLPGPEVCNGVDDNCDGVVDGQPNGEPLGAACYGGPPATGGVGACQLGASLCTDGSAGQCSAVEPVVETCNGVDDDCDGVLDEGLCACVDGDERPCGTGVGECTAGTSRCLDGWSETCFGATVPSLEDCNGKDDDCDGTTDHDSVTGASLQHTCYDGPPLTAGVGACNPGIRLCVPAGGWTGCVGDVGPTTESCGNDVDDDCDGVVDEGCACTLASRPCGSGVGACALGTQACVGGSWSAECVDATLPSAEVCNGLDDDCDGVVDRDAATGLPLAEPCFTGPEGSMPTAGICQGGSRYCHNGEFSSVCLGERLPKLADTCENAVDDDCDGQTDEDCSD